MATESVLVRIRRYLGWAWLACGLLILLVAAGIAAHTALFLRTAIAAQGRVLQLEEHTDVDQQTGHTSITYRPVFAFTARDGQTRSIASHTGTNPPGFAVGDTVEVLYDPANPDGARIHSTAQLWLAPIIVGGLGGFFACAGALLSLLDWRYRRRNR